MSIQITLEMPEKLYSYWAKAAEMLGRSLEDVLLVQIRAITEIWKIRLDTQPVDTLDDDDVLIVAGSQMEKSASDTLSRLLQKQQRVPLEAQEERELESLMQLYDYGQLRKAQAIVEAAKRNLQLSTANH